MGELANILKSLVSERIDRQKPKIRGQAVSAPTLKPVNGQESWVVDVLISSDKELLKDVPLAENNRNIRNFVTEGTPVEVERSNAGQYFVSSLSDIAKGQVVENRLAIDTAGLAFTQGYRFNQSGGLETGNENPVTVGEPVEIVYSYQFIPIPYDELTYGVDAYGAKRAIRTP